MLGSVTHQVKMRDIPKNQTRPSNGPPFAITPRLGGVGPTTVAMLLKNTVEAAEKRIAAQSR